MEKISWPEFNKLQPEAAIDYLRKKGYKTTFNYHEMVREEHAHNFTVAKATSLDVLQDIRAEVDKALADGTTLETFRKNLRPTLVDKGWWGKKEMADPKTGEVKLVQLGSPRRLQIIFDANLRTAYAAGRWEGIEKSKRLRPYLAYLPSVSSDPREQHKHWYNVVKPVDDPFWNDHTPPNGWKCKCGLLQLSARDMARRGLSVTEGNPDIGTRTMLDKRTGQSMTIPKGLDPSFAYNPGKARMKSMVPPPLDLPLTTPFLGDPILVPPPTPRVLDAERLLPDNLRDEEYVGAFLKEFGGDIGKPVTFKDVTGETIIISEDLFKTANGKWKVSKRGRQKNLLLLADAIKSPDEVFTSWSQDKSGKFQLYRSYLVRYVGENNVAGFTMFNVSNIGWSGVTSFSPDDFKYMNRQRNGALAYRRPDKK